jgi:hypothetical protein
MFGKQNLPTDDSLLQRRHVARLSRRRIIAGPQELSLTPACHCHMRRFICSLMCLLLPLSAIAAQLSGRCPHAAVHLKLAAQVPALTATQATAPASDQSVHHSDGHHRCHEMMDEVDVAASADVKNGGTTDCDQCQSCGLTHGIVAQGSAIGASTMTASSHQALCDAFSSYHPPTADRPPSH